MVQNSNVPWHSLYFSHDDQINFSRTVPARFSPIWHKNRMKNKVKLERPFRVFEAGGCSNLLLCSLVKVSGSFWFCSDVKTFNFCYAGNIMAVKCGNKLYLRWEPGQFLCWQNNPQKIITHFGRQAMYKLVDSAKLHLNLQHCCLLCVIYACNFCAIVYSMRQWIDLPCLRSSQVLSVISIVKSHLN